MADPVPLIPVEERLLLPFQTEGLEALRVGVLKAICSASNEENRVRAILLTTQTNDFRAVLLDVLVIPSRLLAEPIIKPRAVFAVDVALNLLREAQRRAQRELGVLGLSKGYQDLLDARVTGSLPQYRVSAACATLVFAALLDPLVSQPIMGLVTEGGDPLTTEDDQQLGA